MRKSSPRLRALGLTGLLGPLFFLVGPPPLADHGDTPLLIAEARHDARITDLYAFTRNGMLVLALGTDPTVPPEATSYHFPSDLRFELNIDRNARVSFDDPDDLATLGGTILHPDRIRADVRIRIHFRPDGTPRVRASGLSRHVRRHARLFTGLRDDPFIRGPRIGRNVAAIVVELPLDEVLRGQDTLLIWATASAPGLSGPFQEMAGRALRSQFPENDPMNTLHPRRHSAVMGVAPDVVIFDTSRPAAFPNGRELPDDVVDLVGDPRVLANDDPFPTENDVPFLATFPYLAPPQ